MFGRGGRLLKRRSGKGEDEGKRLMGEGERRLEGSFNEVAKKLSGLGCFKTFLHFSTGTLPMLCF